MDTKEILSWKEKLNNGEVEVTALPDDVYSALRPQLMGDAEWPEAPEAPAADPAPAAAAASTEEIETPPDDETPDDEETPIAAAPPREVVIARSTMERARARQAAYKAKLDEQNAILSEAEPDRDLEEDKWRDWDRRHRAALNAKADIVSDYAMTRDTEDAEAAEQVVHQSEFAQVVDTIGNTYELLKLPKGYDAMVADYGAWCRKAMKEAGTENHQEAFSRFQTDPEFAKKVGDLPKGWETLFIYMNAEEARRKQGGTLRAHVLDIAHEQGIFKKMRESDRDAAKRGIADKNDRALNARATEARPASVSSGTGTEPEGPTIPRDIETSRKYLSEMNAKIEGGHVPTEEEKGFMRVAREWVLDGGKPSRFISPQIR